MTGRERVKKSLTFEKPDRVPRDLWALPYITLFDNKNFEKMITRYPMDFLRLVRQPFLLDIVKRKAKKGSFVDDWGSIWFVGEPGVLGEVKKPFLDDLVSFMISGPVIVMVLEKENAIQDWRTLMGETDSRKAAPDTIRNRFGTDRAINATHGSDAPETAKFEINFFFPELSK